MELLSVIIPVYNKEKYLKRCLDSVVNQTYSNLEIVLVDDGSTDHSLSICREYAEKDSRINVFAKQNGGVSSARNHGLENCTGELIAFADPDDWLELRCFELLIDCIEKYDVDIAYCYPRDVSEKYHSTRTPSGETGTVTVAKRENFDWLNKRLEWSVSWGAVYKKKTIKNLRFAEDLTVGEDTYFFAQAINNVRTVARIDYALYNYSLNDDSVTARKWRESSKSELIARQRIKTMLENDKILYPRARAGNAATCLNFVARYYNDDAFIENALPYCKRIFQEDFWELLKGVIKNKRADVFCKAVVFAISPRLYIQIYRLRYRNGRKR